ncbi:uncharacterized protein isoform X4 [Danio rerio]|uniref:Uncharacterized protein isoform X4 n=1 Tax=Danio rerio TaxID=7955 RepID=A0AC58GGQ2_DANRE
MSRQQKKGPMKPVSVEQEEEQGRPAEEEMEHKDKDEMASREPTLADLTSLFSAHMAKMDSREAVRKQEHIDQERRFKALQHQFSLLQMEVQARTSPTSDACHIDTHSLDVHGAQADTDNQQFTSPNVFHSNADLNDDRFPPPRFREPRLEKLADSDDIEHFLITFERIATACRWPKADWAFHLIPLLTGRARAAYVQMDLDDSTEYDKVKAAILVKYDINAETYRLRFRSLTVLPSEAPKELYTRLKDLYGKWIKPKGKTTEEVGEIIILEQYLRMLSPELQVWIRERDPTTAAEAAALADVFVAARGKNQSWGRKTSSEARRPPFPQFQPKSMAGLGKTPKGGSPEMKPAMTLRRPVVCYLCGQEGHTKPVCPRNVVKPTNLCYVPRGGEDKAQKLNSLLHAITVKVNGKEFPALIDTGSDQTLVSRKVVAPSSVNASNKLSICCVHGDERLVPTADLYLAVNNQPYLLEVGVVDNLPYPVVLGRDLPVLLDLIQPMSQCNMVLTRAKAKQQDEPAQTLSMLPFYNADLETSPPKPKTTRRQRRHAKLQYNASRLPAGEVDGLNPQMKLPTNISELQQNDTSLVAYFEQANQMEMGDKVMNDNCERFMISENILYRQIGSGKQLIVPKEAREIVLHLSHSIPWAGHLGVRKTIERIKKYFYWPGLKADVVQYCKSCPECQLVSLHHPPRVPLQPLPLISTPFERLGMDIVGPVEKSSLGNRFLLVITDYATRSTSCWVLRVCAPLHTIRRLMGSLSGLIKR